ncbi:hypothetical protein [Streptosporangium sp. NPDC049376]|uniref:hypothetical protein n=1 Tax=Streptosporangium sp. NPDC049376 TaxID=3366192 RepID=UPI00379E33D7
MPPPIDPTTRAAILDSIHAGGKRNEIARQHNVSPSTVSKIARDEGVTTAFDRTQTETATRAKQADNKSRRTQLASLALDDADTMRRRALAAEAGRDARDFATAYGIFIDKHVVLERLDSDNGASEARSMLGAIAEALEVAAANLPDET